LTVTLVPNTAAAGLWSASGLKDLPPALMLEKRSHIFWGEKPAARSVE
jgi:hypothetical protein